MKKQTTAGKKGALAGAREPEPEVTQYMANAQGCRNVGFQLEGFDVLIRPKDPKDNARAVKLARRLAGG